MVSITIVLVHLQTLTGGEHVSLNVDFGQQDVNRPWELGLPVGERDLDHNRIYPYSMLTSVDRAVVPKTPTTRKKRNSYSM